MKKLFFLLTVFFASFAIAKEYECSKRNCKQMDNCEEARYHLKYCGMDQLDRDGDGVPCESICGGKKKR